MATKTTKKPVTKKEPEKTKTAEVKAEVQVADAPKPQKAEVKRLPAGRYRMTGTYIGYYGVFYAGKVYEFDEKMANIFYRDIVKVD